MFFPRVRLLDFCLIPKKEVNIYEQKNLDLFCTYLHALFVECHEVIRALFLEHGTQTMSTTLTELFADFDELGGRIQYLQESINLYVPKK